MPVASIATCVHSFSASHFDKRRRSAVVVRKVRTSVVTWPSKTSGRPEGPHFGCDLAIEDKAQAGHYRLLVNVETATSPMHQLHLLLLHCVVGVGLRTQEF